MKTLAPSLLIWLTLMVFAHARDGVPPTSMLDHTKWARETPDLSSKIEPLEKFMSAYLPREEGGTNSNMKGYGDGSHALAVAGCAWELARVYVKAGQKDEALKIVDWLQRHDSKSMLIPAKNRSEEDGGGQPATRPESK